MVLDRRYGWEEFLRPHFASRAGPPAPPASEVVSKRPDDQIQKSDKELLDSGYMSDCTVICQNTKWTTHKVILCSRSKWFRAALDGSFQEAFTGVVTIEGTDPDVVKVVLDYIYTGQINHDCSTPAEIVQIWKAGDFFDIRDLVLEAENALTRRLKESAKFFRFNQEPKRIRPNRDCKARGMRFRCGHFIRGHTLCAVRNSHQGPKVRPFEPLEPDNSSYGGHMCENCGPNWLRILADIWGQHLLHPDELQGRSTPPPADNETRAMIEEEIRALCNALVIATADTPQDSQMQKALAHHICNTRVAAWGDFTVCRFLKETEVS